MKDATLPYRLWCRCLDVRSVRGACGDLWGELGELARCRSWGAARDEGSDIAFAVGRLLGAFAGRRYVRVPGAGPHVAKIADRFDRYGCVRSERHLVDGTCPNA